MESSSFTAQVGDIKQYQFGKYLLDGNKETTKEEFLSDGSSAMITFKKGLSYAVTVTSFGNTNGEKHANGFIVIGDYTLSKRTIDLYLRPTVTDETYWENAESKWNVEFGSWGLGQSGYTEGELYIKERKWEYIQGGQQYQEYKREEWYWKTGWLKNRYYSLISGTNDETITEIEITDELSADSLVHGFEILPLVLLSPVGYLLIQYRRNHSKKSG